MFHVLIALVAVGLVSTLAYALTHFSAALAGDVKKERNTVLQELREVPIQLLIALFSIVMVVFLVIAAVIFGSVAFEKASDKAAHKSSISSPATTKHDF